MAYLMCNNVKDPSLLFNNVVPECCVYNGSIVWLPFIPESYRVYITLDATNSLCINGLSYNGFISNYEDFCEDGDNPDAAYYANSTWTSLSWTDIDKLVDYNDQQGYQCYCNEFSFRVKSYDELFNTLSFKTNQYYQPNVNATISVIELGNDSKVVAEKQIVLQPNTTYTINRGDTI